MAFGLYHYALLIMGFYLIRICIRSILALRFHFRFGRIGFFSVSNIRYHHHKSSETALWSVKVGKLKLRLRNRPTWSAPTPYLSIAIADIHVQLHSMAALAAARQQHKRAVRASKHQHQHHRKLSRVSSSLKKIPWWYSLSIVKQVIKYTSALPAQLLMAGLANYVDVQMDTLSVAIEDQAAIKVHNINFSSILFADVTLPAGCDNGGGKSTAMPSSPLEPPTTTAAADEGDRFSMRSSHQRHSLKRAQHLFKEKFFEIMVHVGKVSVEEEKSKDVDLLALPSGGEVVISCHLSAACVTLKDVDVSTRIGAVAVQLSPLMDLVKRIRANATLATQREKPTDEHVVDSTPLVVLDEEGEEAEKEKSTTTTTPSSNSMIQLFRSVTLSMDTTTLEAQHQSQCSSTLTLQGFHVSGVSECYVRGVEPYYKVQCSLASTWTLTDTSLSSTDQLQMQLLRLPELKWTANVSHAVISPPAGLATDLDVLPNHTAAADDDDAKAHMWNDDLRPNRRFLDMTLSMREPKIYLDVSKASMLSKLRMAVVDGNKDTATPVEESRSKQPRGMQNLPRGSLSVCIDSPSIHTYCAATQHTGIISWSGITFEANGSYCAQKNRPTSVLPRYSEPNTTTTTTKANEDHIEFQASSSAVQRLQTQSRPSWINLFRRSWKSKGPHHASSDDDDQDKKKVIEWYYKTSMRFTVQNTCFDIVSDNTPDAASPRHHAPDVGDPNDFVSVGNFECNAHTRLQVSFAHDLHRHNTRVLWNPDAHHVNVDTVIDRPVVNLWTRTRDGQYQMAFWASNVVQQVTKELKQPPKPAAATGSETRPIDHSTALLGYLSTLKTSVVIADAAVVLEGVDRGLKGKRTVPHGFLDNAPEQDIDVRVIASVQQISVVFTGSRVFHKTTSSRLSTDNPEDTTDASTKSQQHTPFGSSRLAIQHVIIERIFKSDHAAAVDEHDWHQHEDRKAVILWVSRINTRTEVLLDATQHHILLVPSIVVKKNGAQYSITNHYACLVTAMSTLEAIRQVFPSSSSASKSSNDGKKTHVNNKKVILHKLQFQINRTDVHLFLPGGTTELYLRMDTLRMAWDNQVEHHGDMPPMAIRNVTLFGVSPKHVEQWDQLFELDNMRFSIEKDVDFSTGQLTKTNQLSMSKMYMRIPYGYELCNFVDSTVTLIKAVKAAHARLSKGVAFLFFGPHEKQVPTVIPHMRLVCDLFTFQFEDDPFEARLRSIYKTGVLEQANRIAIQDAFEIKAQTLMTDQSSIDASEEADARVNEAWQKLQQHNSNSWRRHIDAALSKEHATYVRVQSANYRHTMLHGQLDDQFDDPATDSEKTHYLSDMFTIHSVDLPKYPPLLDLTIKHTSLDFRKPDFALDHTRQFIFDVGRGQPLDTPLSTMLPFHLDWKSGETWAQLRDYPIPFISVPPLASSPQDNDMSTLDDLPPPPRATSAWTLSGDYVFGDDLGDLDATRSIHLTVVDQDDAHYAMDIVRTTTPLKFFSIVNIDVHNSALSHICWCVPYQPAIQDITRVMDTFTKPPVDPSQKVGFWDKIRLIIHTRVKISFVGGGDLAMVMKGSRDPYDMSEKGFGLAKVWRNDVVWLLGHQNPQGEFMQIISRDYAFGVPDLVRGGYTAPYIVAADHSGCRDPSQQQEQQQQMRQSVSMSSFNSSVLSSSSDENGSRFVKIALKLSGGIRMGLGCHLERMCSSPRCEICDENSDVMPDARAVHKSRLLHFLPHYKVKLKAPQNVHDEDYDAYRGFRSDFIHTSISIIKTSDYEPDASDKVNVTGNSMHLTPGFIDHFVSWFRLFGGAMSYPLRAGSLFPKLDTRPTQKFGRHMSTMKYKVVVNPLTCGYFIKDENVVAEEVTTQELGDSVGLKGFVKAFSVDIHQRREIVNVANYKLDQKRLKANWPVTEAEVQLKNIDLRAVKASYALNSSNNEDALSSSSSSSSASSAAAAAAVPDNVSVPVQQECMSDESDNGLDMMEGLNYRCNNDSDSSDWVDLDDFIEMGVATPAVLPAIQVLPFAFSPCIYYLRQTNKDDVQKFRYLHDTHDCILGTAVEAKTLMYRFESTKRDCTRLNQSDCSMDPMKKRFRNWQVYIHRDKRTWHAHTKHELFSPQSDAIVEKTRILYEKRELLQRYLKELSTQHMPDVVHTHKKSDAYSQSTIFGKDSLAQWEELMGYFKVRYIAHNPQILWNNSVRNILYHGLDLKDHRRALSYYMTARTVKFLRDLIEASDLQYSHGHGHSHSHSHKPFVLDDDEGGMDTSMAEELIAKLLSEQETKFYAPNETEEEKPLDGSDSDSVDMSKSDNVNNPLMQLKTIPHNYVMKSSYLVDLLNPQISLQSDCDPDNIVLVANERTQVKGFNIIDETDPDVEMEMVKHRTVVSLDNVQFFVAKKEQFDSVDLLLDNHYGAKESDHWLAWIPPEMLISYVKRSDKFQRIGDRIAATLQYDKYNPLRIKTSTSNAYAQVHPFEDRCDSVQLNFPSLKLTADSSQYNAVYQVATDLLLYKEPAKKERLARLREIMMAADRSSLYDATEKIVDLQSRARQLLHARDQYRQNMALLDDRRIDEFKSIRLTLYDTLEELYLGMEAIKLMQSNQRKDFHEPKTNLKFVFCAEKMEWEMLSAGEVPLCECVLTNFTFNFVSKEDHSSTNTLEVDVLQVTNLSPAPVFVHVLAPYFDSRKPYDFSRHKMLRCYFVSLAPVGGIPVIQHLEINLHPMRVQMTYSFGRQLAFYLFPPEKHAAPSKQLEPEAPPAVMAPSTSAPTTTLAPLDASDQGSTHSASIIIPQASSSERSDHAAFRHHAASSVASAPVASTANLSASFDSQKLSNSSQLFMSSNSRDDVEETPNDSPSSSTLLPAPQSTSSNSNKKTKKQQQQQQQQNISSNKLSKFKTPDDLSVMKKRASSNRAFILGPKEKNIEDLRDFAFEQPTLEFRNETWSWFELMSNIKKDFMRAALLHNSTALLKEKLLRRHPRENAKLIDSSISMYTTPVYIADHVSTPTTTTTTTTTTGKGKQQPYDVLVIGGHQGRGEEEDASESSSVEDTLDPKDIASLHSAHSNDMWDTAEVTPPPPPPPPSSKKTHIWQKLKKSKKGSSPERHSAHDSSTIDTSSPVDSHPTITTTASSSSASSPALARSISASTRHLNEDDQLTVKGRYLLGKYYNGPTQWLAPGAKLKGKQINKKV
ncbi:hypothetical protein MBANPS3_002762 [Mucor bainieri]